jgi:ABC-type Co2+ transport system permease subunit
MYFPPHAVPLWLGIAGWLGAGASVAAAALRLRRRPFDVRGAAAAAAFVAALRLLSFPLSGQYPLGGSALALGFAVIVFGVDVAVIALAAATVARMFIAPEGFAPLGAELLVHAAAAPWLLWWGYRALKKRLPSETAGYVLAFGAGAGGPPLVAGAIVGLAAAGGAAVPLPALQRGTAAALALTAAEGALATWGYVFAHSRRYAGDGEAAAWTPASWRGAAVLALAALALAGLVSPLTPREPGPFALKAMAAKIPPRPEVARAFRVVAGLAVTAGATLASLPAVAAARLSRPRRPKKTPPP